MIHRHNLQKLAEYLIAYKPIQGVEFNMNIFACIPDEPDFKSVPIDLQRKMLKSIDEMTNCGTAGCSLGHGPFAGFEKKSHESWMDYSNRLFIIRRGNVEMGGEWDWCFAGEWSSIDNTPMGAGKRIMYLLQFGLPTWFEDVCSTMFDGDGFHIRDKVELYHEALKMVNPE